MRLRRLKLTNWCQYPAATVEFADGLNLIRGPNGSGKSNMVTAGLFALTGDLKRNAGVKESNIYQFAKEKDRSGVELLFEHGNWVAEVTRNLRPASCRLHVANTPADQDLRGAKEITAKIEEMTGVNARLLSDYVFVEQWSMFAFIDQDPAEREKAFAQLFGVDQVYKIHRLVGEEKVDVPSPAADRDKVKARLAEYTKRRAEMAAQLDKLGGAKMAALDIWATPEFKLAQLHNKKLQHIRLREKEADVLAKAGQNYARANADLQALVRDRDYHASILSQTKLLFENAQAAIKNWHACHTLIKQKEAQERIKADCESYLNSSSPAQPGDYLPDDSLASFKEAWEGLRHNAQSAYELAGAVEDLKSASSSCCPTCMQPIDQLLDKLPELKEKAEELNKQERRMANVYDVNMSYRKAVLQWDSIVKSKKEAYDHACARLAELQDIQLPEQELGELQQIIEDFTSIEKTKALLDAKVSQQTAVVSRVEAEIKQTEKVLVTLDAEIGDMKVSDEEAGVANRRLFEMQEDSNVARKLNAEIQVHDRVIQDDQETLKRLDQEEVVAARLRGFADHLDLVQEKMKELPVKVATSHFNLLRKKIDRVLEEFGSPYRLYSFDGLKFVLQKDTGAIIPADRLSGGERVVFALAFRMVVNSEFAGQLGLLCLDEPTAGLDSNNLRCVEVALRRLRELSKSQGLQVICITHDKELDHLFDRVIELPLAAA